MVCKDTSWRVALLSGLVMLSGSVDAAPYGGWTSPWESWWVDNPMLPGFPGYRDYSRDYYREYDGRRYGDRAWDYRDQDRSAGYPGGYYPRGDYRDRADSWRDNNDRDYNRATRRPDDGYDSRRGRYGDERPPGYSDYGSNPAPGSYRSGDYGRDSAYRDRQPPASTSSGYGGQPNDGAGNTWGSYPNTGNQSGNNTGNAWGSYPNAGGQWGNMDRTDGNTGNGASGQPPGSYPTDPSTIDQKSDGARKVSPW